MEKDIIRLFIDEFIKYINKEDYDIFYSSNWVTLWISGYELDSLINEFLLTYK